MIRKTLVPFLLLWSSAHALDMKDLENAARYSETHRGSALLVLQDGREVYARAQNGFLLERTHFLASGSKSFSCAIAVALQAEGKLNLDEPVIQTLTEWKIDPQKASITARQLLGFTSGLPGFIGPSLVQLNRDMYGAALNAPLQFPPGEHYTYGNAHLAVFGALIERKTGQDAAVYLQKRVLDPIGVQAVWQRDQSGHPNLAGSASMTARGWAKYGQLILQKGQWEGKTILPAKTLEACFQGSSALSAYGLTWWLNVPFQGTLDEGDEVPVGISRVAGNQQQIAPSAPKNLVMAAGAFNQRLYILPDEKLVVVRFGEGGEWSDETFLKLLLGK
ncbi:serine hydrolase domain-containing protein [Deinococcus cellulosilyticus]|uniref:Beta-lactamase-related domain-containing protein n=1 Tax=Deinococcus cellulosilyticus (strain DSM 18568 / NBRC 106333 / KACC 11606 / 5516J-15) TaxID=1223518 RepID=A0A511MY28_DEIC1|nr:serine hydrolase [Deinococcus cellulosilyticus]GEM45492.1 hypothetical protein DC3_11270 [Deinococcus cellulosilyticus NBRC 106333 = KACC 11606]